MFGNICRNEGSELLIDLVVLMVLIHSPDIIQHILVYHRTQLFVLNSHLPQQKLYSTNRNQNVLCTKDHYTTYTFFAKVWVQSRT